MKDNRTRSLSVKLSVEEENKLYEATQHLHDTKKITTTKTAAIRYLIEEAYRQSIMSKLPDTAALVSNEL